MPSPKPKHKRKVWKCAKRKLLTNLDLFLNPLASSTFTDKGVLILGKIQKVPQNDNDWQCEIEWKKQPGMDFPVPTDALRTKIARNNDITKLIDEAPE